MAVIIPTDFSAFVSSVLTVYLTEIMHYTSDENKRVPTFHVTGRLMEITRHSAF